MVCNIAAVVKRLKTYIRMIAISITEINVIKLTIYNYMHT